MSNSRDVRLTIRARDEASKIIAKVGVALNQYANGMDKAAQSLVPLQGKLAAAIKSVSELQSTMVKTSAQIGINKNYQIISESISKMSSELNSNRDSLQKNSDQLSKSKAEIESLKNSRDDLKKTLIDEKRELVATERAIKSHTKSLADAEKQSQELNSEIAKRDAKMNEHRVELERATQAQRAAEAADQRAIRTAAVLADRLSDLRAAREAQRRSLTGSSGMSARTDRVNKIAASTADPWAALAARGFQEDEGAVRARLLDYDKEIQRVDNLREAAKRAQQATANAVRQQSAATKEISKQMVALDNLGTLKSRLVAVTSEIQNQTAALQKETEAQVRLSTAVGKNENLLSEQNAAIQISQTEIQKLESENRALTGAVDRGTAAVEKSTSALNEMQVAAKAKGFSGLGQSVDALEKRLARLSERYDRTLDTLSRAARYSDGGGSFTGSEDAAKLRKLNEQLTQAKADSEAFKKEIDALNASITRGDGGREAMKADIRSLSQAMGAAEADARQLTIKIREIGIASGAMRANIFDVWGKHNQDSRTALNLYQRLRGQVLSLVAAYGGLYGVAAAVQSISQAFMVQEAALSRLGVVFDGNQSRMAVELDWIRRNAQRLGIEFGVLSQEYTKFAVGAANSGFAEESIRKIFLSVAEAGRVNKLSLDDLQGTFLALSQMIGKSKISAEELRQQLGERLPGAVKLMADALGLTISELDDLMKKGQVFANEENMLKFAAKLSEVFGGQLPTSLRSFSAELGRLQNTIYQSKVLIGQGGLISALGDAMRQINEYANSEEGVKFFLALGAAMGEIVSYVPVLIENFETVIGVLKVLMSIGIASVVRRWMLALIPMAAALGTTLTTLSRAPAALAVFSTSLLASSSAMGAAGLAARGLGAALITLGPLVAAVFIGSQIMGALGDWSEGVDSIVQSQAQHERIMDRILQKYEEAKGKTYDWIDALNEKDRVELIGQYDDDVKAFETAVSNVQKIIEGSDVSTGFWSDLWHGFTDGSERGAKVAISTAKDIAEQFKVPPEVANKLQANWEKVTKDLSKASRVDIQGLIDSLTEFSSMVPDGEIRTKLNAITQALEKTISTGQNVSLTADVLGRMGNDMSDASDIASRFGMTIEEAAQGVADSSSELNNFKDQVETQFVLPLEKALKEAGAFEKGFKDFDKVVANPFGAGEVSIRDMITALDSLKSKIPEIARAFKTLSEDKSLENLSKSLSWMFEIPVLGGLLNGFVQKSYGSDMPEDLKDSERFGKWAESGLGWMIRAFEDYRGSAYADQNEMGGFSAWRVGYGSDTVTDPATGKVRKTQKGETISREEGEADLMRRINEYMAAIVGKIGQQRWDSFSDEQREVLLSLAHNYGTIPDRIINVVRSGTTSEIADAIRGEIRQGSVNNQRRGEEATIFERGGNPSSEPYQDAIEERTKAAEKAAEDAAEAAKSRDDEYRGLKQNLEVETLRAKEREREAFIMERINQFTERHGEMSETELANLKEQYGALYDLQNAKTAEEKLDEKIKKHQEEITRLETERNALLEQREYYKEKGEADKVGEIDERLKSVNSELNTAIEGFIAFWKTSGSDDAAGSIETLESLKLKLKETGDEVLLTADDINDRFAGGISDSISAMVEALATGENAWSSFRDAFLSFSSEFLIEIGKMIAKQALLAAFEGMGGSGSGGLGGMILSGLQAVTTGVFHSGKGPGRAAGGMNRSVSAALFNGAPRFHQGKLPGLRSGEMAAIIEEDEEVLPPDDPRHAWNLGKSSKQDAPSVNPTIINAIDSDQLRQAVFNGPNSDSVILNKIKLLAPQIKVALK